MSGDINDFYFKFDFDFSEDFLDSLKENIDSLLSIFNGEGVYSLQDLTEENDMMPTFTTGYLPNYYYTTGNTTTGITSPQYYYTGNSLYTQTTNRYSYPVTYTLPALPAIPTIPAIPFSAPTEPVKKTKHKCKYCEEFVNGR